MERQTDAIVSSPDRLTPIVDSMLGVAFLGLAAWFLWESPPADIPLASSASVSAAQIAPGPRRIAIGDPPATVVGGYSHTCNDCHRLFTSPPMARRDLLQHERIVVRHGINSRCFNCHDVQNRERLVLIDGSTVPFAQTPRLCAQCHGPVFRDWEHGTHGKTLGSWDAASGKQHRLGCTECHDPHSPAYEPIQPLPGPNTLRMGDQSQPHDHPPERHMPLRRGSSSPHPSPAHGGPPTGPQEASP